MFPQLVVSDQIRPSPTSPAFIRYRTARFARKESRKPDGQWSMSDTAGLQSRKAAKPQNMRPHSRKQQTMNPTSRTQHATAAHIPYSAAARQPMALCRESNAATPPRFTAAQPTHDTSHAAQHRGNSRTLVILYSRFLLASWAHSIAAIHGERNQHTCHNREIECKETPNER